MDMNDIKISKMKVDKNDLVVVKYDHNKIRPYEIKKCYDGVKEMYPNNIVIAIPNGVQLMSMRKEDVVNQLEMLLSEIKKGD